MCTACTVIGLAELCKYLGTLTYLHSKLDELHEFSEFGALVGLETGLLQIEPSLTYLQRERMEEGGGGRSGGGREKTSWGGGEDRSGRKGKEEEGKRLERYIGPEEGWRRISG